MAGETIITVVGNLTADPELRFTQSGAAVCNFTVASTPRVFDRNTSEWRDGDALFMRCNLWRQPAENVAESLTRGARVIVTGRLHQRSFETREGEKRSVIELDVEDIGPSLRYATAKTTKTSKGERGADQGQDGWTGTNGDDEPPLLIDMWREPSPAPATCPRDGGDMRVHYIPAIDLQIGDLVIPDHGQSREVAGQQTDTGAAYVCVQYVGIPGCTTTYPARMSVLISSDDRRTHDPIKPD